MAHPPSSVKCTKEGIRVYWAAIQCGSVESKARGESIRFELIMSDATQRPEEGLAIHCRGCERPQGQEERRPTSDRLISVAVL
jgi:hypothetical protein